MANRQQQLIINLDEYITFKQKMDAVESLMELLDLDFETEPNGQTTIITVERYNYKNDVLHQVMREYDKMKMNN